MANLRRQQYYYFFFLTIYILTGAGALILGNVWLSQSAAGGAPRDAVISREIEQAGTIIGGVVVGTAVFGLVGGAAPIKLKVILTSFVFMLIGAMLAELGLGGVIWFKTLRMRSLYQSQWPTWSDTLKIAFQDMTTLAGYGQCCGYTQFTDVVLSGACADPNQQFDGCEEKVSAFADGYLRKLFTSLFGFTVVNVFLFVSAIILILIRNDEERYIRIRNKEGRTYTNAI